jgi:hypothetical protein
VAETAYRVKTLSATNDISTLIISCSSAKVVPHLRDFVEEHLKIPRGGYDYLCVPGGPHFLLLTEYLPKFSWAGQRWVKFLFEQHRLKRIVLVGHENCSWYADERMAPGFLHRLGFGSHNPNSNSNDERQLEDLRGMIGSVQDLWPTIRVDAYFAEKDGDSGIIFRPVT